MASLFSSMMLFLLLLSCFSWKLSASADTITATQPITDRQSILSNGSIYKLGFFSPGNSTHRYVGIWYNCVSHFTVVWVANRDQPLESSSSGTFTISQDGNLVVLDEKKSILWSSNITSNTNSSAQLLDSGNLVLRESGSGKTLWESFDQPSHMLLPKMKLSTSLVSGKKQLVTSWETPFDPSQGEFSAGLDLYSMPEFVMWKDGYPYWRSGPWNGQVFVGIGSTDSVFLSGYHVVDDKEGNIFFTFAFLNDSVFSNFNLDTQKGLTQNFWSSERETWMTEWSAIETDCDVYAKCGPSGVCDSKGSPICSCLKGFEPKHMEEWGRGNWTGGCVRKKQLQCERTNGVEIGGEEDDGFLHLTSMKLPYFSNWSSAVEGECKDHCLKNCSCVAYGYSTGIGCMTWSGSFIDTQKLRIGGADLYVRVPYSEIDQKGKGRVVIAIAMAIVALIFVAICAYFSWRWKARKLAKKQTSKEILSFDRAKVNTYYPDTATFGRTVNQVKLQELPAFGFESLAMATNNFDASNKLGQGGFGPVYMGKLQDAQEIAVKRLSRASGQGIEEFMNEVVVISRLQHRNLVKLLGCCVEGEEKMLVYEYMPNKSLDAFLFDPNKRKLLDWRKRFEIIGSIGRGLLYLHRDSRLRIIHRDLKASNILLDEELNPKISDFGMARIFGGNQDQANTNRVVGTYGYMSPEYAMQGRFSEKSDVFSFGVLLLEIVSGRRNTSFYHDDSPSLLGFLWRLWNEEKITEFIDPMISDPSLEAEIVRCIHVGLLCVQEFAQDRPTISTAVSMVNSEITDLPAAKQPAFTERRIGPDSPKTCSVNHVTVTMVEGR